ncbi:MFS transporter [Gryllotalpicola daejeonensis]|uniref:MFS transporter n=1 Tax=Gryllotalpicola daejeonensis TaxID=993087 RepID=A0ABP7ZKA8_9MICO
MAPASVLTRSLTAIMAVSCGLLVANLYFAQAAIEPISRELGISPGSEGLVVTLTQFGYAAGLLLIATLVDVVENRRLVLITVAATIVGLIGVTAAPSAPVFLLAAFVVGVSSVGAQVVIPLATHLAPAEHRGRVIGDLMAGLLGGIMLSRPYANFVTGLLGWRWVFGISAGMILVLLVVLWLRLPGRQPEHPVAYGKLLSSTFGYLASSRVLQRRAAYHALAFAAFNFFWTCAPLMLHATFGLSQLQIALFALAGAGGALVAPLTGRLADRGHARMITGVVFAVMAAMFLVTDWAVGVRMLVPLIVAGVLIDAATQGNQVAGQRIIFGISPEARGRVNSAYTFTFFLGGAVGSLLAPFVYEVGGWSAVAIVGASIAVFSLLLFLTERIDRRHHEQYAASS